MQESNKFNWGGALSGIGSIMGSMGDYSNPADAAMGYFNQIPGTIKPYYEPYIDAGKQSLSTLQEQYKTLLNDPGAIMNLAGKGFQQSPGYQFQYNQGMNAANSAAAAGGMLGTPYHQQNASSMASNLANQDFNNYLSKALGLYGTGLQGNEGINQMGYQASDSLASSLAAALMNQGNMAYAGQANANQNSNSNSSDLWGGIGALASAFF